MALPVGRDQQHLVGGRSPSLLLGGRPEFFCCPVAAGRTTRRLGGATDGFRNEARPDEFSKLGHGDLAIAQLGTLLRGRHGDGATDEFSSQAPEQHLPLLLCQGCGSRYIEREFRPAVRGVDVLTARSGRTGESPTELRGGDGQRRWDFQIHASSLARLRGPRGQVGADILRHVFRN